MEELVERMDPIEVWTAYFAACKTHQVRGSEDDDSGTPASWVGVTNLETPQVSAYSWASLIMPSTPRLRIRPILVVLSTETDADDTPSAGGILAMNEPPERFTGEDATDEGIANKNFRIFLEDEWHNKVNSNFEDLTRGVSNLSKKDISLFKSDAKDTVQELQEVAGDTQTKLQLIHARIGMDNVAWDSGTMSVCESIRKTQDAIKDGAPKMEALDGEVRSLGLGFTTENNSIAHLSEIVVRQKEQFAAFEDKYGKNLKYPKQTLTLCGNIRAHRSGSADDPMDLADLNMEDRAPKASSHSNALLAALMERVDRLEGQHRTKIPKSTGYDVSGITPELEARFQTIERQCGSDCIYFNDKQFGSSFDLESWVGEQEIPSCGLFWDLFSCLAVMSHGKQQTGKGRADSKYLSQRTKTTLFEDDLLASMGHECPSCLFRAEVEDGVASKEFGFTTSTSYMHWIGAGAKQSYKHILASRLEVYVTGVKGVLRRYPSGPVYWADQARLYSTKSWLSSSAYNMQFY
jgi:hypothetical protein